MDIHSLNKTAWDKAVDEGTNPYTQVVSSDKSPTPDGESGLFT
jgi:hypothetical protein